MKTPALERIAFQPHSSLTNRIINAVQKAMDVLKSSRTMNGSIVQKADLQRIAAATKILYKTFIPELITICKEELNLNLEVHLIQEKIYIQACMYLEYKSYSKDNSWMVVFGEELFKGVSTHNPNEFDQNYFKQFSEDLDLNTSKLKTYTKELTVILWLWTSSFISEEITDVKIAIAPTAEEITAVILHELGHAITIIEHMGDVYYRSEEATNSITYLNEKASDKTLVETISNIKKSSLQLSQNEQKAVSDLNEAKSNIGKFSAIVAIVFAFFAINALWLTIYTRLGLSKLYSDINKSFNKTSDVVVTKSNESYMERIADEFVSRHGLGKPLATILSRINIIRDSGTQYTNLRDAIENIGKVRTTLMSFSILLRFFSILFYVDDGTYDPDWLRLEHLLSNNMVIFKDDKLDPELRNFFLKETKDLIELIDKFKSRNLFKTKQLIWGTIFKILSRASIVDSFSTAGLTHDYDQLQLLTNGLIKNKLFYQAARIKNI